MINRKKSLILILCFAFDVLFFCPLLEAQQKFYGNNLLFPATPDDQGIKVLKVLSVNSILLENGEKIRLIGIKPTGYVKKENPEVDEFGFILEKVSPETSLEQRALDFVQSLLEGQLVDVEFDAQRQNEHFENLGYVFLAKDKTLVNAEILRQGFALLHIQPPNTKYADLLRAAYQEARREQRGLHGE